MSLWRGAKILTEQNILRLEVSVREYQRRASHGRRLSADPAPELVFGAELHAAGFDPQGINVEVLENPRQEYDTIIFTQLITEYHGLVADRIASDLRQQLTAAVEEDFDAYSDTVDYPSEP